MQTISEDDKNAITAATLYSEDDTFKVIADKLETSKSYAQVLVRRGITLLKSKNIDPSKRTQENLGSTGESHERTQENPGLTGDPRERTQENLGLPGLEERYRSPLDDYPLDFNPNPRPGSYTLETAGIPKRIILTPKALMIFEIWTSCGFEGDLSDFIEDSVNYLYETRRPEDRRNYR